MEPEVIAALIAALVALGTSLVAVNQQRTLTRHQKDLAGRQHESAKDLAVWQSESSEKLERLRDQLEAQRAREKRERDAEDQLNLYREPLLDAAKDLFHRIRNIREKGFLGYVNSPDAHRKEMATLGTLYRFGKYWGTVDSLYGTVNLVQFQRNSATRDVADLLTEIGTIFASDSPEKGGGTLMVWREEQRAIAELMQRDAKRSKPVIGFATFAQRYPVDFAPWFAEIERDLLQPGIKDSPRLAALQATIEQLVARLESGRT